MSNEVQDIYELTPLQQGMLFHSLYSSEISAYNIQMSIRLQGQLSVEALNDCWETLVQRHQVLRTSFIWEGVEKPYQVVHTGASLEIKEINLSSLDPDEKKLKLDEFIHKDRIAKFDLETSPLMRITLLQVDPNQYYLLWTFHHIILEGWSASIILNELWKLYDAKVNAKLNPLPPVNPYTNYIKWLKQQDLQQAEYFWKNKLKTYRAPLQLPFDRGDVNTVSDVESISFVNRNISVDQTAGVQSFARNSRVTVNTVIEGALSLLLSRYTGEDDIVFGAAVSGRPADLEGVESIVGLFVNVLPVRIQVDSSAEIKSWLQRIQIEQVEMREYEYTSLMQIKSWSELSGAQPVFNIGLAFENWLGDIPSNVKAGEIEVCDNDVFHTSDQPLTFFVTLGNELGITLAYNTDRFDAYEVEQLLSSFVTLLTSLTDSQTTLLADVSILSAEEKKMLLYQWNQTGQPPSHDRLAFQSVEKIAIDAPAQPAVISSDTSLDFETLNHCANQLAHYLIELDVSASTPVTVLMDRTTNMIVSLLAILKTGSHYLPIDPEYPEKRLRYILDDTKSNIVITQSNLVSLIGDYSGHVLCMDEIAEKLSDFSVDNPDIPVTSDHVAYIIYTSGSTGQPKGVEITHAGLSNLISWHQGEYQQDMNDRVSHMAGLGFDATVWETWPNITCGATLYLVPDEIRLSVSDLWQWIVKQGITISFMATPLAEAVLAEIPEDSLIDPNFSLRVLHIAGDKLHGALSKQVLPFRVANLYGPTENTVCATFTDVDVLAESEPSIGRPIDNVTIYILDKNKQAVPVGVTGMLYIGGKSLAKGYFNQPKLSRERFINNPFSKDVSDYLYNSGDLACFTKTGEIEFVGRADDQVKIRGFRIELGEIEALLNGHDAVQSAVVIIHEPSSANKQIIAYAVINTELICSEDVLLALCQESLPTYMLPSAIIFIDKFPLTYNGKIDKKALPDPSLTYRQNNEHKALDSDLEKSIGKIWSDLLGIDEVGTRDNFFDLGGHSLLISKLHSRLKEELNVEVSMVDLFQYPTIETLSSYIDGDDSSSSVDESIQHRAQKRRNKTVDDEAIAVIGMAGRFPGAVDIHGFWQNLVDGVESIRFFTDDELIEAGIPRSTFQSSDFVPARGYLDDAELFDASFFSYSPRDAEIMDPQHRQFLECCWNALEHAACDPESYSGLIGVFAGASINQYFQSFQSTPEMLASSPMQTFISNEKDFLAARVAYKLNLRGPVLTIQTACSTSLVAIHEACRHLSDYSCDVALAGGVSVIVPRVAGSVYQEGSIVSPDGHCRAFDAAANGTVGGEGVGVVVLKRLSDAITDRDTIHAIVKGSAINNDGLDKAGFTAPGINGQANVIAMAQANAGISADTIDYVEAHGTGTTLGDPIEATALTQAFSRGSSLSSQQQNSCALGAVKTNIGHLDSAAGVAGFIKTVLSIKHAIIPASLNYTTANPKIDFKNNPFYVNTVTRQWPVTSDRPRRAGISAFGIGGTNAHIILEQAPHAEVCTTESSDSQPAEELLVISAKTKLALDLKVEQLAEYLKTQPDLDLQDLAYTLQVGRSMLSHRCMLVSNRVESVIQDLQSKDAETVFTGSGEITKKKIVFMFSGQGSQYPEMAKDLYQSHTIFRETVDHCCEILRSHIKVYLLDLLYPDKSQLEYATEQLTTTQYAQCALFVIEYATAKLWMHWGIRPAAMIGHSIGEYAAACLSGVISLHDTLQLVANRGRLMQTQPSGSMLSVSLTAAECHAVIPQALKSRVSIATVNAPSMCVISGQHDDIDTLEKALAVAKHNTRRLHTSHAFHSSMMEPVLEPFIKLFDGIKLHRPEIPFVSNLTGDWITDEQAVDAAYWAKHLRNTVLFSAGLKALLEQGFNSFIEIGPGNTLATFARQHISLVSKPSDISILSSIRHPRQSQLDSTFLLNALGQLWIAGHPVDWSLINDTTTAHRIPLPAYPFERKYFWLDLPSDNLLQKSLQKNHLTKLNDIKDWVYIPAWKSLPVFADCSPADLSGKWLVFSNGSESCKAVMQYIEQQQGQIIRVTEADNFAMLSATEFTINPTCKEDYTSLFLEDGICSTQPQRIIHCWGINDKHVESDGVSAEILSREYYSVLYIIQTMSSRWSDLSLHMNVLTQHSQSVDDRDVLSPEKSMVSALLKVLSQEVTGFTYTLCDLIDEEISMQLKQQSSSERLAASLQLMNGLSIISLLIRNNENQIIALRRNRHWLQIYEPVTLKEVSSEQVPVRLQEQGVYMITGGLGGVGLALAGYLADKVKAKLILVARSVLPEQGKWEHYLETHELTDKTSLIIKQLHKLHLSATDVTVASCDVTDKACMQTLVESVIAKYGQINGVIHAAGVVGEGSIVSNKLLSMEGCEQQFRPKVHGLMVLKKIFEDYPLDFIMPVSSLSSVLGGIGFAAYSAANQFMDSLCLQQHNLGNTQWISVNWDGWRFDQVENGLTKHEVAEHGFSSSLLLTEAEGKNVFEHILNMPVQPQIIISTGDLELRLKQWVYSDKSEETGKKSDGLSEKAHYERPVLSSQLVEAESESQKLMSEIWISLFNIKEIGMHDNFFELGGHSLLAVQAVGIIKDKFHTNITIDKFLELGTIEKITSYIDALNWVETDTSTNDCYEAEDRDEFEL